MSAAIDPLSGAYWNESASGHLYKLNDSKLGIFHAHFTEDGQKDWQEVVVVFKANGYEWGGNWHTITDNPHLQKTFGLSISQCREKYNAKDFIPSTQYINIS